jgi:hypothetical protein
LLHLLLRRLRALAFRRLGLSFPNRFCIRPVRQRLLGAGFLLFRSNSSEEIDMAVEPVDAVTSKRGLTLDWWAVLLALVLALLVRAGVLQHIPW